MLSKCKTGEKPNQPFHFAFNASLHVDLQGSRVSSDCGLILVQELDERLGLIELIGQYLTHSRGKNTQLPLAETPHAAAVSGHAAKDCGASPSAGKASRRSKQISALSENGE